jgi:hypothetical protein
MSSMGMDKSGTFALGVSNTWVKVQGFVARSGYGATVITNHALVMDTPGTGNIRWRGQFGAGLGTQQFRVVKNGSTIVGPAVNMNVIGTASSITMAIGDTLELQGFSSNTGAWGTVQPGAAVTFLEWNQTTSNQDISVSQATTWNRTVELGLGTGIGASQVINWGTTLGMSWGSQIATADTAIAWDIDAELYQGEHLDIESSANTHWNISADMLLIKQVNAPPSVFAFDQVAVSVHTVDGRMVGDFPCKVITSFTWGREANEVSICDLQVSTQGDPELVEAIRPWVHWITMWHDDVPVWTGPIQGLTIGTQTTQITARDPSTFMWRTRVPITRQWAETAPARIASDLWSAMFSLHQIRVTPHVLPGVADATFTLSAKADAKMLHQLMDDLTKVGLQWTVVAGRPVLGEFSEKPIAELAACDFMVELERRRDGSATFNDVRVQGQNWAQTAIADLAGLHLQTLVSMDDLYGSSNIQRATQQYAKDSARIRDEIYIPPQATLHPEAPVTFNDLVPGKVFVVHGDTSSELMRLDQLTVTGSPDRFDVQVTLVALGRAGEIARLTGGSNA